MPRLTAEEQRLRKNAKNKERYEAKKASGAPTYYSCNKEKVKTTVRAYAAKNKEKIAAKNSKRHFANKEAENAKSRAYHAAHREEQNAKMRARYADNKEEISAQRKVDRDPVKESEAFQRYYQKNKAEVLRKNKLRDKAKHEQYLPAKRANKAKRRERINAQARAAYAEDPTPFLARTMAYRARHPGRFLAQAITTVKRRRARKKAAPINDFTEAQWQEMQAAHEHRCVYCGTRCKGKLTQDHIIPLSQGGGHTVQNILPACRSCNSKKQAGPVPISVQPMLLTVVRHKKK